MALNFLINKINNSLNQANVPIIESATPIGLIVPPLEIKNIIDKTAKFVAKNGKEFETKILENASEDSKPKFGFFKEFNPYNAYYKKVLDEEARKLHQILPQEEDSAAQQPEPMEISKQDESTEVHVKQEEIKQEEKTRPTKDPLPYFYDVSLPKRISPLELETIRLAAQFTARNGSKFMNALAGREAKNTQFDFLRMYDRNYEYFTKMTNLYKTLMFPNEKDLEYLQFLANPKNQTQLLELLYAKAEWETLQQEQKVKEEKEIEQEQISLNSIDWHDFVVVETINFDKDEVIVPPTVEEEKKKIVPKEKVKKSTEAPSQVIENAVLSEDEIAKRLKKNFKPSDKKAKSSNAVQMVINPITNELVPLDELQEQLRVQLLDPKWKDQKAKELKKFASTNMASGTEFAQTLFDMAAKRSDIFGKEEVEIGKATNGESDETAPKIIWDGHSSSAVKINAITKNLSKESDDVQKAVVGPQLPQTEVSKEEEIRQKAMAAAAAAIRFQNTTGTMLPPPPPTDEKPTKKKKTT